MELASLLQCRIGAIASYLFYKPQALVGGRGRLCIVSSTTYIEPMKATSNQKAKPWTRPECKMWNLKGISILQTEEKQLVAGWGHLGRCTQRCGEPKPGSGSPHSRSSLPTQFTAPHTRPTSGAPPGRGVRTSPSAGGASALDRKPGRATEPPRSSALACGH